MTTKKIELIGGALSVAVAFVGSAEDIADLVAYLKRIDAERVPGADEKTDKVGTLAPL